MALIHICRLNTPFYSPPHTHLMRMPLTNQDSATFVTNLKNNGNLRHAGRISAEIQQQMSRVNITRRHRRCQDSRG